MNIQEALELKKGLNSLNLFESTLVLNEVIEDLTEKKSKLFLNC